MRRLLKNPKTLFAFFTVRSMCSFRSRLLERSTPKYPDVPRRLDVTIKENNGNVIQKNKIGVFSEETKRGLSFKRLNHRNIRSASPIRSKR